MGYNTGVTKGEDPMTFTEATDLNGVWVTKEQLDARIDYCDAQARVTEHWRDTVVPGEWTAQYAARSLFLESQYQEQWEEYVNDEGLAYIEEMDYIGYIESCCEDYAYQDVYENGNKSTYSYMVWTLHHECYDFNEAIVNYAKEMDLPFPGWLEGDFADYE